MMTPCPTRRVPSVHAHCFVMLPRRSTVPTLVNVPVQPTSLVAAVLHLVLHLELVRVVAVEADLIRSVVTMKSLGRRP